MCHMASYGMSGREQVRLCVSHGVIQNVWQRTGKIVCITWCHMECLAENKKDCVYHMASYGMSCREQVRLCVSHGVIQNVWQRTGKIVCITWCHMECLAENKKDFVYHMASYGMSSREQVRLCVSHGIIRNVCQRTGKIVIITWHHTKFLAENR